MKLPRSMESPLAKPRIPLSRETFLIVLPFHSRNGNTATFAAKRCSILYEAQARHLRIRFPLAAGILCASASPHRVHCRRQATSRLTAARIAEVHLTKIAYAPDSGQTSAHILRPRRPALEKNVSPRLCEEPCAEAPAEMFSPDDSSDANRIAPGVEFAQTPARINPRRFSARRLGFH